MEHTSEEYPRIMKQAATLLLVAGIIVLLRFFEDFLQPFVVALILWFLVIELRKLLLRLRFRKLRPPKWVMTILSTALIFLMFYLFISIIVSNLEKLSVNLPEYSRNLSSLLANLQELTGTMTYDVDDLEEFLSSQQGQLMSSASVAAQTLAAVIGQLILVLLYVIFLLLEEHMLIIKLDMIVERSRNKNFLSKAIPRIQKLFSAYLSVKISTSFLTGLLSFAVLRIIGVELAAMWAFIIFVFNFIPNVGSMLATGFPVLFSIVQYGNLEKPLIVLICIALIQLAVGNFIEPRIMGNRLNLSPLIVLMGLVFWGFLWGFIGMILSVPISAMLLIIFSQFEETENVAILFSQDGKIEHLLASQQDQPSD